MALLLPSLRVGGAERQALELARRLPAHGWSPSLIVCEGEGPLVDAVNQLEIPWVDIQRRFDLPKASPWFWFNVARTLARIRREIRRRRPAILQSFLFWENQLAMAALGLGAKFLQGRRDGGAYKTARPWYQWVENQTNRHAARIVCNSEGVRADVLVREKVGPEQVCVIPNGVDTDLFSPGSSSLREAHGPLVGADFVVGTVGNLKAEKRHDLFIRMIAELASLIPNVRGVIVGGDRGGRRVELERLARDRGVADRLIFAGRQDNPAEWLRAMDVFVLTSDHEGMPNVVLEAMATGLPVVGRAVQGIGELIPDDRFGRVIQLDREVGELTKAVLELSAIGSEKRGALGQRARERMVTEFSLDRMAARYSNLYSEVIGWTP